MKESRSYLLKMCPHCLPRCRSPCRSHLPDTNIFIVLTLRHHFCLLHTFRHPFCSCCPHPPRHHVLLILLVTMFSSSSSSPCCSHLFNSLPNFRLLNFVGRFFLLCMFVFRFLGTLINICVKSWKL